MMLSEVIECPGCGEAVELGNDEKTAKRFICPLCGRKIGPVDFASYDLPGKDFILAERLSRFQATTIDGFLLTLPIILVVFESPLMRTLSGISFIGLLFIQFLLLARTGQTIGENIKQIRIIKIATGKNGGFITNVLCRAIPATIMALIPIVDLIDVLFIYRKDRRCLHDLIAGTIIIEE